MTTWERRRESMVSAIVAILVAAMALTLLAACGKKPTPTSATLAKPRLKLAVLAVESDRFPEVAEAATVALAKAHVTGMDQVEISKVSLEVVQLSIECVEQTAACYEAVGKSLAANRLLFAQVAPGAPSTPTRKRSRTRPKEIRVTITLFDVDTRAPRRTAERTFPTESDAAAGIENLLAEATTP